MATPPEPAVEQVGTPPEAPPAEQVTPTPASEEAPLEKIGEPQVPAPAAEPSPEAKPAEEVREAEPAPGEKPPEEKPPELTPELAEQERALTPEMKQAFQAAPQLRGAFFRDKDYTQIFQTPENARHVWEEYQTSERTERLWNSTNPEDHRELLSLLAQENPQAFNSFGTVLLNEALPQYIRSLHQMGETDLAEALERVKGIFLAGTGTPGTDGQGSLTAREQALAAKEQAFADRTASDQNQRQSNFVGNVQETWEKEADSRITARLEKLSAKLDPWTEDALRKKVLQRVDQTIGKDDIFKSRYWGQLRGGDLSPDHNKAMVKFYWNRIGSLLDDSIADELSNIGPRVVSQSQAAATATARTAAAHREAGGGGPPSKPAPVSVKDMKPKPGETADEFQNRVMDAAGALQQP